MIRRDLPPVWIACLRGMPVLDAVGVLRDGTRLCRRCALLLDSLRGPGRGAAA